METKDSKDVGKKVMLVDSKPISNKIENKITNEFHKLAAYKNDDGSAPLDDLNDNMNERITQEKLVKEIEENLESNTV